MKPLMLNISVKFHSDIPNRKGTKGHKLFSRYIKGRYSQTGKVSVNVKHICEVSFRYHIKTVKKKQVIRHNSDLSRADNTWNGKVRSDSSWSQYETFDDIHISVKFH